MDSLSWGHMVWQWVNGHWISGPPRLWFFSGLALPSLGGERAVNGLRGPALLCQELMRQRTEPCFLCVPSCPAFTFSEPQGKIYELASCLNIWDFQLGCQWGHHEYPKDVPAQPYQQLSQPVAKMLKNPTDICICVHEICLLGKLAVLLKKKTTTKKISILEQPLVGYFFPTDSCIFLSQRALHHTQSFRASRYSAHVPHESWPRHRAATSSQGKPLCDGLIWKKLVDFLGGPPSMVLIAT